MARGGRREGSGRKRKFTELERYEIGECCENLYQRYKERAEDKKLEAELPELSKYYRKLDQWTASERRKLDDPVHMANLLDEFDLAIRTQFKTDADDYEDKDGVQITDFFAIPQGVRDKIKKIVAASIFRNHNIEVSVYTIDKSWQMFRNFKRP